MNRHISHLAASHGLRVSALTARASYATIAESVAAIRAACPSLSASAARAEYDRADVAAGQYQRERSTGINRRARATIKAPLALDARYRRAARQLLASYPGERYSGTTDWSITCVTRAEVGAKTITHRGEQYSRRCTYKKTDATHHVLVCFADLVAARRTPVPAEIDGEQVIRAQQVRAGVYAVTTLFSRGKSAACREAFAADQGAGMWHLAATERGAVTALNRSLRTAEAQRQGRISAAICAAWGWCAAGIRQWCDRHGIRRNLAARLRAGASSAALARLIARHGGPRDAYEQRIMLAVA